MRCPSCGSSRDVSLEQARRIARGKSNAKCRLCRHEQPIRVSDEDRRFWLRLAGVTDRDMPDGPSAYVRRHGLPSELQAIVASAFGAPPTP